MSDGTPIIIKKKKGHGGHAHHGGSWKVAYADFVTAMMAFFMVMWIMGLSQETRSMISGYFNDPLGFAKNEPRNKNVISMPGNPTPKPSDAKKTEGSEAFTDDQAEIQQVEKKVQGEIDKLKNDSTLKGLLKNVDITVTPEGLRIELVEATDADFFQSGSAILSPAAKELVSKIGPVLGKSGRSLIVEGHTDSVPYPSQTYNNWDLSSDRANALRRELSFDGVSIKQFKGVRALADTEPKIPNDPTNSKNRRVSLLLPMKAPKDDRYELPKDQFQREVKDSVKPDDTGVAPPPAAEKS